MELGNFESLTRVLQVSISPVALISGVGLLMLSETNRFSRVVDRLRELTHAPHTAPKTESMQRQIEIFHLRARILRMAISLGLGAVLLASILVLHVFVIAVLSLQSHALVMLWFALSLLCLIGSLVLFLWDMHLSLRAVQEEMGGGLK